MPPMGPALAATQVPVRVRLNVGASVVDASVVHVALHVPSDGAKRARTEKCAPLAIPLETARQARFNY